MHSDEFLKQLQNVTGHNEPPKPFWRIVTDTHFEYVRNEMCKDGNFDVSALDRRLNSLYMMSITDTATHAETILSHIERKYMEFPQEVRREIFGLAFRQFEVILPLAPEELEQAYDQILKDSVIRDGRSHCNWLLGEKVHGNLYPPEFLQRMNAAIGTVVGAPPPFYRHKLEEDDSLLTRLIVEGKYDEALSALDDIYADAIEDAIFHAEQVTSIIAEKYAALRPDQKALLYDMAALNYTLILEADPSQLDAAYNQLMQKCAEGCGIPPR
ncbi:MAG: hypothetical protein ACR652_22675 [Methylocystis sp.]|uniref:hypothetical protein n=1 Tax=Methylocystis sp. TaxID=1911079 RepID=UPI003DA5FC2A